MFDDVLDGQNTEKSVYNDFHFGFFFIIVLSKYI